MSYVATPMPRLFRASAFVLTTGWVTLGHAETKQACVDAHTAAQELRQAGKLKAARDKLALCSVASCPGIAREDCTKWLAEVDKALPTARVELRDSKGDQAPTAHLTIDSTEPPPPRADGSVTLDPGPHTFHVEAPGYAPLDQTETLQLGEHDHPVHLILRHAPEPTSTESTSRPVPPLVYVLGAAGIVGIAGFSYFALSGKSGQSNLEQCKPACPESEVDSTRTKYLVANVAGAVGLLGLGAATVLFLTRPSAQPTADPSASIHVDLSPRNLGLRAQATF